MNTKPINSFSFFKILTSIAFLLPSIGCSSAPIPQPASTIVPNLRILIPAVSASPTEFADAQLKSAGLPDDFIKSIHTLYLDQYSDQFDRASHIVELNVFGFLSQNNYELQDSPLAQRKIKKYLRDHQKSFRLTRKQFPVSSAAIASLLWVETKYGKTMGTFPMPWVYYALVLGSHPTFIRSMLDLLPSKLEKGNPKNLSLSAAQEKVIERCKSKAAWALEELRAINQIKADHDFDPFHHTASFAGAFGIPQFIPSTYLKTAVSEFRHAPNLYKHSDAIRSVAHFLYSNGWKDKDPDAEALALFSYNRSKDYGAIILKLAQEVSRPDR